mmetsp:Transcript_58834/g.156620  ORF Transcript_58834/g.156620 Transcript_58834/m.156620 type:complete len:351 (-) Transcript_58834:1038-2090(-)
MDRFLNGGRKLNVKVGCLTFRTDCLILSSAALQPGCRLVLLQTVLALLQLLLGTMHGVERVLVCLGSLLLQLFLVVEVSCCACQQQIQLLGWPTLVFAFLCILVRLRGTDPRLIHSLDQRGLRFHLSFQDERLCVHNVPLRGLALLLLCSCQRLLLFFQDPGACVHISLQRAIQVGLVGLELRLHSVEGRLGASVRLHRVQLCCLVRRKALRCSLRHVFSLAEVQVGLFGKSLKLGCGLHIRLATSIAPSPGGLDRLVRHLRGDARLLVGLVQSRPVVANDLVASGQVLECQRGRRPFLRPTHLELVRSESSGRVLHVGFVRCLGNTHLSLGQSARLHSLGVLVLKTAHS